MTIPQSTSERHDRRAPLRVTMRANRLMGISFLLLALPMAYTFTHTPVPPPAPILLAPVFLPLLGIYLLLTAGSLELDDQGITRRTVLGVSRMAWSEFSRIDRSTPGRRIYFYHRGGRIAAPGTGLWAGADRQAALDLLEIQIRRFSIPP